MEEDKIVKSITDRYTKQCRYLIKAKLINGRKVRGTFKVNNSAHLIGRNLEHLAITETQTCVNQLFQVYVAYLVENGYILEWGPIKWDDYWCKISSEHLFVVENHIDFNEKILPGVVFNGTLTLHDEFKSKRGNYHLKFHFDLNDGAHTGFVRIAFIPKGVDYEEDICVRNPAEEFLC